MAEIFRASDLVRGVDLRAYAEQCGYELRSREGGQGIAVLEHPRLRDRVAVAQAPDGRWVFADVRHYAPRGPNEPADRALARLRECIDRSPSKGGLTEFAQRTEGLKRDREALDVLAYAQRSLGYELCSREGGQGVMVLESARLRDRIAVAQAPDGHWLVADVRHYALRGPGEAADRALVRLRECIDRSPSKGSVTDLVARAGAIERGMQTERPAPGLARSREAQVMRPAAAGREDMKRELLQCRTDWHRVIPQPLGRWGSRSGPGQVASVRRCVTMLRNDEQSTRACRALMATARLEGLWTREGPTVRAAELLDADGGPLASGELIVLLAAFPFWNGRGGLRLADAAPARGRRAARGWRPSRLQSRRR